MKYILSKFRVLFTILHSIDSLFNNAVSSLRLRAWNERIVVSNELERCLFVCLPSTGHLTLSFTHTSVHLESVYKSISHVGAPTERIPLPPVLENWKGCGKERSAQILCTIPVVSIAQPALTTIKYAFYIYVLYMVLSVNWDYYFFERDLTIRTVILDNVLRALASEG